MPTTVIHSLLRVTAKEIIDRAHQLVPGSRGIDNRYAGRVLRTMIVDQGVGEILDDRARFPHGDDLDSPVDCAVYEVPADTDLEALARALGETLAASRR